MTGYGYAVGDQVKSNRLGVCAILAVHAFGAIDVQTASGKRFRISGLAVRKVTSDE